MKLKFIARIFIAFQYLILTQQVSAMIHMDDSLYGEIGKQYYEEKVNVLDYLFVVPEDSDQLLKYKDLLVRYRGFFQEGDNLENYCRTNDTKIKYPSKWHREQVKRSMVATLQYIVLDTTVNALARYAKLLNFSQDEYGNFVEQMIGNNCSQNLSVISLKQLKSNFFYNFENESPFQLPTIQDNPFFVQTLSEINSFEESIKQEMLYTVKIFRSFCSWGNKVDNLRMLVPFLKSPVIMAFLIRQMTNSKILWRAIDDTVYMGEDRQSVQVVCREFVCRKQGQDYFYKNMFHSIDNRILLVDFKRLYCEDFQNSEYVLDDQVPQIKKWIDTQSFDETSLQLSQLIALLTKVPDFLVRSESFSDGIEFLRASIDQSWLIWAVQQLEKLKYDIDFEEPLLVEKVERRHYFDNFKPEFKVVFDVNWGEFDRVNQMIGKLKTSFNIKLSKSYLARVRKDWVLMNPEDRKKKSFLRSVFRRHITDQVQSARKKYKFPPWKGNIERLIVSELLTQLELYQGDFFRHSRNEFVLIPIELNFGPFALKYMNQKHLIKRQQSREESRSK